MSRLEPALAGVSAQADADVARGAFLFVPAVDFVGEGRIRPLATAAVAVPTRLPVPVRDVPSSRVSLRDAGCQPAFLTFPQLRFKSSLYR